MSADPWLYFLNWSAFPVNKEKIHVKKTNNTNNEAINL